MRDRKKCGQQKECKLSLDVRLDPQRHMRTLGLTTLDVSFSDGRDVGPGHVIGRDSQRKLESPDQGIENGFDSVRTEYSVSSRKHGTG